MTALPICCITGRVAGDNFACGDCDPCGAAHTVPEVVKRLIKERDEWADKYAGVMMELDELRAAAERWLKIAVKCEMILADRLKPEKHVRNFEELMTFLSLAVACADHPPVLECDRPV